MGVNVDKLRSDFEVKIYKSIQSSIGKSKTDIKYEPFVVPYTIERTYKPDFVLKFKDGHEMWIEAKGYLRYEDAEKLLAVKHYYPTKDIRIVFQKDNKIRKNSNYRYSDWAKKYGFQFAIGDVPIDWLNVLSKNLKDTDNDGQ